MEETNSGDHVTDTTSRAYETLGQYLRDDEWYPQQIDDAHTYRVGYTGICRWSGHSFNVHDRS